MMPMDQRSSRKASLFARSSRISLQSELRPHWGVDLRPRLIGTWTIVPSALLLLQRLQCAASASLGQNPKAGANNHVMKL